MNLHFSFKAAKSPDVEKEIQQHVQKLEQRLKVFRPDLVHLHGTLDAGPVEGCTISLNLRLPSGQLSAHADGANAKAAVKAGFADLKSQLNKHKDLLRSEHKWSRDKAEIAAGMTEIASPNEGVVETRKKRNENTSTAAETDGGPKTPVDGISATTFNGESTNLLQAEVRQYLSLNLKRLERYVARELRLRESNGEIEPGLVSRDEVIDEVAISALSAEQHNQNVPVERWLFRLTYQAIQRVAGGNSRENGERGQVNIPLEESVGTQNVTGSDEAFLQFHQPGEAMHGEDVIADRKAGNPEEQASSDETIDEIETSLSGTSPADREAFVLFAIEGFTVTEIAEITARKEKEVRSHILSARDHLMKKLPKSNSLKKKLMEYSRVA